MQVDHASADLFGTNAQHFSAYEMSSYVIILAKVLFVILTINKKNTIRFYNLQYGTSFKLDPSSCKYTINGDEVHTTHEVLHI